MTAVTDLSDRHQRMSTMIRRPITCVLFLACLLAGACSQGQRTTIHLPATDEVGWVEFIVPSRAAPVFTVITKQKTLARVALNAKPGERNDDRSLLAELTTEADRPLVPTDPTLVTAPSVGCAADTILIATGSGHVVVMNPQSITRDGIAVDPTARRWFLAEDGNLRPLTK